MQAELVAELNSDFPTQRMYAIGPAAVESGGITNGVPDLRPSYYENYLGACVIDPEGNNIDAVCHNPE
jgi:hypothetical protein